MTTVIDNKCQLNAQTAAFFVSALGEMERKGELLDCSSINLAHLAKEKGFDLKNVFNSSFRVFNKLLVSEDTTKESKEFTRWNNAIEYEFDRRMRNTLTVTEYYFAKKIHLFQEKFGDGRFRFYGEISSDTTQKIILCTEFLEFIDNDKGWEKIYSVAKATNANTWVMREDPHLDISWTNYNTPEQVEHRGPDHNRMERQIEFAWRVETHTVKSLYVFIKKLQKETKEIWSDFGVAIL